MTNINQFEDVLLPNWEAWDGNGVSDIPALNTKSKDNRDVGILISNEAICVYNCPVEKLNTESKFDEGSMFIDMAETPDDLDNLQNLLTDDVLAECKEVYTRYIEFENASRD